MKRQKLTANKLAFGNLRARRKQYTLMIVGIILAMIFSSGTIFFFACSVNSQQELLYRAFGRENMILMGSNSLDHEKAVELDFFEDYATVEVIGYGHTPNVEKGSGVGLGIFDEKALYYANPLLDSGRLPEKKGEIAIEKDALIRMKQNKQVGDKITLTVSVPNGEKGEIKEVEKTYTICGILNDKRSNMQQYTTDTDRYFRFPAAMVSSEEQVEAGGKAYLVSYVLFNYDYKNENDVTFSHFLNEQNFYGDEGAEASSSAQIRIEDYMVYSQKFYSNISSNVYLIAFLMAVLMLASCFGIVNAFNTNLQERRKQIGLLRAVGMTKRQVINIFGREALIIGLISAPASVLLSYFGVKLYAEIMGDGFIFKPEWWVLFLSAGVGLVCVMAAAFIPLVFAARVTPMQAIRNTELTRKVKNKKIKSQKLFTAPKLISKRSLLFYRAKQVGIIFILTVTFALPCVGFGLIDDITRSYRAYEDNSDYWLGNSEYSNNEYAYYPEEQKMDEAFRNELYLSEHTGSVSGTKNANVNLLLEEHTHYTELLHRSLNLTDANDNYDKIHDYESYMKYGYDIALDDDFIGAKEKIGWQGEMIPTEIHAKEASDIEALEANLISGKINIDRLNSGEEIILCAPEEIAFELEWMDDGEGSFLLSWDGVASLEDAQEDMQDERFFITEIIDTAKLEYKVGDTVDLCILMCEDKNIDVSDKFNEKYTFKTYRKQVKIGAIVSSASTDVTYSNTFMFATTNAGLDTFGCNVKYNSLALDLNKKCTDEINEDMMSFITSVTSGKGISYNSNYEDIQSAEKEVKVLLTGLFAVVILFFCISASLINNAITAKIRAEKRTVGTLRAVGASTKELTQAFIYQLLNMFGWGSGLGFAIYSIGYLAFRINYVYIKKYPFTFPYEIWEAVIIFVLLFAVCSINLYLKIKKEMKNSIVENIREL